MEPITTPDYAWHPIETIPKDGKNVIVYYKERIKIGHWNDKLGYWDFTIPALKSLNHFREIPVEFTHWQYVPEPSSYPLSNMDTWKAMPLILGGSIFDNYIVTILNTYEDVKKVLVLRVQRSTCCIIYPKEDHCHFIAWMKIPPPENKQKHIPATLNDVTLEDLKPPIKESLYGKAKRALGWGTHHPKGDQV